MVLKNVGDVVHSKIDVGIPSVRRQPDRVPTQSEWVGFRDIDAVTKNQPGEAHAEASRCIFSSSRILSNACPTRPAVFSRLIPRSHSVLEYH